MFRCCRHECISLIAVSAADTNQDFRAWLNLDDRIGALLVHQAVHRHGHVFLQSENCLHTSQPVRMQHLVAVITTVIDYHVGFVQLLQMRQCYFSFITMLHKLEVNWNARLQLIQTA